MPRGLPDVAAQADLPPSARRRTCIEARDAVHPETLVDDDQAHLRALECDQHLVEALLRAIAKRRYLVLATGNGGRVTRLACPASVAGLADSAIVVAAVTRAGWRASYSNGAPDPSTLLHVVSDDAEILHREDQRIETSQTTRMASTLRPSTRCLAAPLLLLHKRRVSSHSSARPANCRSSQRVVFNPSSPRCKEQDSTTPLRSGDRPECAVPLPVPDCL